MHAIKQLVNLSSQIDLNIEDLSLNMLACPELNAIYSKIQSGEFKMSGNKPKNNKLFGQLLDTLSNRILLIDFEKTNKRKLAKYYFETLKQYMIGRIFMLSYMYEAGEKIFLRCIAQAEKFDFTELIYPCALRLFDKYSHEDNVKLSNKYKAMYEKYLSIYTLEGKVYLALQELLSHYNRTKSSDNKISIRSEEILEEFKDIEYSSRRIEMNLIYIKMIKFTAMNDSYSVYKISQEGYHFFEEQKYNDDEFKLILLYQQLTYLTQTKNLEQALVVLDLCYQKVKRGESHWFRVNEYHVLVLLYCKKYEEAIELFFKVFKKKGYDDLIIHHQERWRLLEAYIQFLLEVDSSLYTGKKVAFSIAKYVNDLPRFSKDKRAMNIPILIAQMLFMITRKKYSAAIDRIEALEKYNFRYLKNNDTYRSNCFIKALLEIPKKGFHRIAVERSAKKYVEKLVSSEIKLINQPFEIEIIPYEDLWNILIEYLGYKHHKK